MGERGDDWRGPASDQAHDDATAGAAALIVVWLVLVWVFACGVLVGAAVW